MDAAQTVVAIGTRKDLWLATSTDRQDWQLSAPHFLAQEVPSVAIDTRNGRTRVLAGLRSEHWGPTVVHSDDHGATWIEPDHGAIRFGADDGAALERVWQIRTDTADRPDVVWAGCEPISVWRSTDGGSHFELERALWDHPHRPEWGAGFGGAAAHTVEPYPTDDGVVHVAMSTGGVYRTVDGGASWSPVTRGIPVPFLPDPQPEYGQCVHRIARDAADPDRLYAQNHGGVFRTDDAGGHWTSISEGLPADFGFVMLAHPSRGGTPPGSSRWSPTASGSPRTAGWPCTAPRTPVPVGPAWTGDSPTTSGMSCCAARRPWTPASPRGSTWAPGVGRCTPAPTRARASP